MFPTPTGPPLTSPTPMVNTPINPLCCAAVYPRQLAVHLVVEPPQGSADPGGVTHVS